MHVCVCVCMYVHTCMYTVEDKFLSVMNMLRKDYGLCMQHSDIVTEGSEWIPSKLLWCTCFLHCTSKSSFVFYKNFHMQLKVVGSIL